MVEWDQKVYLGLAKGLTCSENSGRCECNSRSYTQVSEHCVHEKGEVWLDVSLEPSGAGA